MLLFCLLYLAGGICLAVRYEQNGDPILRRQLRWLRDGTLAGTLPFILCYGLEFAFGAQTPEWAQLAALPLVAVPLTWAYAIFRHHLLEVDIIFEQGYVYTLATIGVIGAFCAGLFALSGVGELTPVMAVGGILFATFLFLPIRNWIQEQLERNVFYRDRYEHRRTLVEFARELGGEVRLADMLHLIPERVSKTLFVSRVAIFLTCENGDGYRIAHLHGAKESLGTDLGFLKLAEGKPYLFFEQIRPVPSGSENWPESWRRAVSDLGLTYYLPCYVRGRAIAYIGLSLTDKNDFLPSDDIELLLTFTGYVGIALDNARLYQSLEQKADQFERLKEFSENIVESVNVGIVALDLNGRVESWNSRMERLTGISRERAHHRPLRDLIPLELYSQFENASDGVQHVYKVAWPMEGEANGPIPIDSAKHSHPRERTVNLAIAPLVSKDSHQIGRLLIVDDVTSQSEMERQLMQADKLSSIGLLAAGVAHEVNTPLAVISTYSQMLAKQIPAGDQKAQLLERISKQTFRASEIVNSLLNFSRTAPSQFIPVDLNRVIRETLPLVQHQLEKTGVSVTLDLTEPLPVVRGNAGKLQQVFLNLFLNAKDAMEAGGRLTIVTGEHHGGVSVEVRDTGHGISSQNVARIYDPFFTTKGAKKGTGLGLSVTYGIVQEHGGTIEVESAPGQGTCFRLDFPLQKTAVHA